MNILVTGGTSGLGKAVVEHLAVDTNNIVFFTYNKNVEMAEQLTHTFSNVFSYPCDFIRRDSVKAFLAQIAKWDLDVLINNAYADNPQGMHFHKQGAVDFLSSFHRNVVPVIQITQAVLDTFRKKKSGKIITILTAALFNLPPIGYSIYAANKAYILQLSKSWNKEYIKYGITSNCISPDFMETTLTHDTDSRIIEQIRAAHPLKQILTPDEVAACVCFLVNATAHVNGVNIPINAGTAIN